MPKHYVYVLRSLVDEQFYVGMTSDLVARQRKHNAGLVSSTQLRARFELVYWEGCLNRSDAAQREKYLKTAWGKSLPKNTTQALSHGVKGCRFRLRPHHRPRRQRNERPCDDVATALAAAAARTSRSRQSHARAGPSTRFRHRFSSRTRSGGNIPTLPSHGHGNMFSPPRSDRLIR